MSRRIHLFYGYTTRGEPEVWIKKQPSSEDAQIIKEIEDHIIAVLEQVPPEVRQEFAKRRQERERDGFTDDYDRSIGSAIIKPGGSPRLIISVSVQLENVFTLITTGINDILKKHKRSLSGKDGIVWIHDPRRLAYLRKSNYGTTSPRFPRKTIGRRSAEFGILVGYELTTAAPYQYSFTYYWLKKHDRDIDPTGIYAGPAEFGGRMPAEAVDPRPLIARCPYIPDGEQP